jgi:DNA repair protein RadC
MNPVLYSIPIYRLRLVRDSSRNLPNRQISQPRHAAEILAFYLEGEDRENIVVLMLDKNRRVIGISTVAIGTLTASIVHPREVFKPAILADAQAIILGHNHPSGGPEPTPDDILITLQLVRAGHALQIPLLDHVIISIDGTFVSLAEKGYVPPQPDDESTTDTPVTT